MEHIDLRKENRSLGFVSIEDSTNIPAHILCRILVIRDSRARGVEPPPASREYIIAAEKRGLSAFPRFVERQLFPVPKLPTLAQRKGTKSLEDLLEADRALQHRSMKAKLTQLGRIIAAEPKTPHFSEAELRAERRRCFPMEFND